MALAGRIKGAELMNIHGFNHYLAIQKLSGLLSFQQIRIFHHVKNALEVCTMILTKDPVANIAQMGPILLFLDT